MWFYAPAIALPAFGCFIYAVLVRRLEKRRAFEIAVTFHSLRDGFAGVVMGAAYITSMWLLLWILQLYSVHRGVWTRWFDDLVFDSYISAVLEELAFRAVLLRIFARMWGVPMGVFLSSVLFGLAHITHGSALGVLGTLVAGVAMGLLYVISGRLWMSIGMHLGYDFIETSVLGVGSDHGLLVSAPRSGVPGGLTGGVFGPDASILGMLIGLVLNIALWQIAFRKKRAACDAKSYNFCDSRGGGD